MTVKKRRSSNPTALYAWYNIATPQQNKQTNSLENSSIKLLFLVSEYRNLYTKRIHRASCPEGCCSSQPVHLHTGRRRQL